jgi:hypothetical protein
MSEEVTKKKIELEVEVGTTTVERGVNPYQNWIHAARAVDAWRIFPRVFLSVYIFLLYYSVMWFMDLKEPTLEQSGLISIIVGAGAAWFGLYAGTSNSSKGFKGEEKKKITYVGYQLAMSPYGIQFSDNEDKLTMEKLSKHDFEQGDVFVLYEDTEGKVCLKKDRDHAGSN